MKAGEQAVPALQKLLASQPALETRLRVEELLDKLTGGTLTAEQLRFVRAVEALEKMQAFQIKAGFQKKHADVKSLVDLSYLPK